MRREIFQAIADTTRRDIILLIAKKPIAPNIVAEAFDVSRQAISKHMKILMEYRVLTLHSNGRERYYSTEPKSLVAIADWVEPFRKMWEQRFDKLDQVLEELMEN
ncbi:MAG: metalloregulator ArsR/SmtB family transcription factor [Bacteroidetes bacterium]|nr:metalloregulator ArsR/SmtB family transcription factor [Bacteroidota bacterium]